MFRARARRAEESERDEEIYSAHCSDGDLFNFNREIAFAKKHFYIVRKSKIRPARFRPRN